MKFRHTLTYLAVASLMAGCGTMGAGVREAINAGPQDPSVVVPVLKKEPAIKEPRTGAMTAAVYSFRDLTGQRKSQANIASLSSAVTQGADAYLIRSLQTVGSGRWFKVVERGGLDNLVKERQLIRQMRELYEGKDAKPLPPMVFAGVIFEGGIIGYDSNTLSGGSGARILGIGAQTEYRQDEVTVSLRTVSVATGEVLTSVNVTKTVISWMDKLGVLRFNELGTRAVEAETGAANNESMNKAVQLAIHAAVIETIFEGERKGHWQFKEEPRPVSTAPAPVAPPVPEVKQNELVQDKAPPAPAAAPTPAPQPAVQAQPEPKPESKPEPKPEPKPVADSRPAAVKQGKINTWTNVRETKLHGAQVLGSIKAGTQVEIVGRSNSGTSTEIKFIKKDGREMRGWVLSRFVDGL